MDGRGLAGRYVLITLAALAIAGGPSAALAQDSVRIGAILPMTGPFQSTGWQANAAIRLFLQQRGTSVAGKSVELLLKDDAGVADNTKRLAQELIVRDRVHVLL